MAEFSIVANGTDMGSYKGATAQDALNAYAKDAGYSCYQAVIDQFGDEAVATEIGGGEFIGYTVGLQASNGSVSKLVQVEYTRNADRSVGLKVVSSRNLAASKGFAKLTAEEFADRPQDACNNIAEARWALGKCGWSIDSSEE